MKKIALIIFTIIIYANSFAAPDYFPIEKGNTWTFSYSLNAYAIVPNALVTNENGQVVWEILWPRLKDNKSVIPVKQTRSLVRRTETGGSLSNGHDTTFNPPVVSIDTLFFQHAVDTTSGRTDSIHNAISFDGATCPFAVHNPAGPLPVELSIKDTAVSFPRPGPLLNAVKVVSKKCGCNGSRLWSFVFAPTIGPVDVNISVCPGILGVHYSEARRLISHSFPTSVINTTRQDSRFADIKIKKTAKTIVCTSGKGSQLSSVVLYAVSGREIKRFALTSGSAVGNVGGVPSGCYVLKIMAGSGVFNQKLWLGN